MTGRPDAVVFPGQGAQRPGMAADYHARFRVAREAFEEASDAAGEDLARICFEQDPRLRLTEFTQPCLLTAEVAAYRVATEELGLTAELFGGHSLGEYTALVAAGAIPFADAVRLVRRRGAAMQEAVPPGEGGMAALILDEVEASGALAIVAALGAEVANRNSPRQVAISGTAESLEEIRRVLEDTLPDLEYVPLRVSAPFHSRFMRPAEEAFRPHLEACAPGFRPERAAAVTSNLTGGFHRPEDLVTNLVRQISSPVRWLDNMEALASRAGRIYEIGPRGSLTKFFRTLGHTVTPLTKLAEAEERLPGRGPRPAPAPPRAGGPPGDVAAPAAAPAVAAEDIGDPQFRQDHGTRLAYVVGGMGWGIGGPELVVRAGRSGLLAFLGTAGLEIGRVERDLAWLREALAGGEPWGVNLTHDRRAPGRDGRLVEMAVAAGVPAVEVSGFTEVTPEVVRCRLTGLRRGGDGEARPARRVLAKVAAVEVARLFLAPPPPPVVRSLVAQGLVTDEEAALAPLVPLADDVCVDVGGAPVPSAALGLMPAVLRLRDRASGDRLPTRPARVGLAGGLGSPEAIAGAFALGADFVLTGSVNQCTVEAGTSDAVKDMLAGAGVDDFTSAPDAGSFELGGRVAVLRRGTLFAARADALDRLYRGRAGIDRIGPADRRRLERDALGRTLADAAWEGHAGTAQALRWYLEDTIRRAVTGEVADRRNFQVRSSPAMGAFNGVVEAGPLGDWRRRHVDDVGWFLMREAAARLDEHRQHRTRSIA